GFSLNFPLGSNSAFQTGLFFERKGYSIKDSSSLFYQIVKNETPVYYVNTKVQTNYAIIPVLMKFTLGKSHRIFIKSGPWLGLKLNAKNVGNAYNVVRSESEYSINKTVIYDDFTKLISDNDIGWIFGTGVSLPVFNKFKVDLALQYSLGFKNAFDKPLFTSQESSSAADYVIRNRTVSFMIGFTIPPANH
ncbi:MAG: outer membrane beta-barrel protein, partial [Bacteroidales bacterium]